MSVGVVGEEGGWGVGGGAGVDDVAADGAAVLVGDAAGPAGGLDEEREVVGDDGVVADVGEGGSGADGDGVGGDFDEAELFEVVQMEMRFLCGWRRPAPRATMSSVPPAMGV